MKAAIPFQLTLKPFEIPSRARLRGWKAIEFHALDRGIAEGNGY
jgi:hypothetical protein